jgi:hypothetical protein
MKPPLGSVLMQEVHSRERTPQRNMKPELKPHIGLK